MHGERDGVSACVSEGGQRVSVREDETESVFALAERERETGGREKACVCVSLCL